MNKKERDVLHSLCNGDITFTEAATLLETSEEKVEELLGNYTWTPSPEKLSELRNIAMENFQHIELKIHKEKILEHVQRSPIGTYTKIAIFKPVMDSMVFIVKKFAVHNYPKG